MAQFNIFHNLEADSDSKCPIFSRVLNLFSQEVLLREHREQEDTRRLAVDYAVNDLLARDTQYRNELDKQMEDKMRRAEKNRKQNEYKKSLSILEARR